MKDLSVNSTGVSTMTITLEDLDGNTSLPATLLFVSGKPSSLDEAFGEDIIPDPILRAKLQEMGLTTIRHLTSYAGDLDLSNLDVKDLTGLTLMTSLTSLTLTGTPITELTASMLPASLVNLDLSDCTALVKLNLDGRPDVELNLAGCTGLTKLSLVDYGDHALDLSDCPSIETLTLTGTKLQALDITALTKLAMLNISNSEIAELTGANNYPHAYNWNWENSKLDLTSDTAAGKLMTVIKDHFANDEIPDRLADTSTQIGSGYLTAGQSNELVINLGNEAVLDTIVLNSMYTQYGWDILNAFTVEISTDGESYAQVAEVTGNMDAAATVKLPANTLASYVKVTVPEDFDSYVIVSVNAFQVAQKDFAYNGQQPAMERDDIAAPVVKDDGATYQMLDLLSDRYASTRLVKSGTLASTLVDADWMDQTYLTGQITAPKGVKVEITDPDGGSYVIPVEGPTLGEINRDNKLAVQNVIASGQNSGEEGVNLFDGDRGSKWCTGSNGAWVGFELEQPVVLGEWYTLHAGQEGSSFITSAYRLQVLNPEVLSEEDYLAMDESGKRSALRNSSNWKDLDVVTGNTDNEVTREIGLDSLSTAQVYRFVVDQYTQPGAQYGAVRVYEMELYGYTGQLGANTNGLLKADAVGEYQINYTKAKESIASTAFTVEHDILSWEQTKEATCTEEGEMKRVCANCGLEETITLAALGHKFGEGKVTKEATCEQEGEMTYTCTVCGETHTEAIAKAEHPYTETVTAPTCEGYGYTTHTCTVCGHSYVDAMTEPTGHSYETVVTEPTCDTMGYTTHTCSVCGDSYIDTFVPATDHDYEQTVTKEATCTQEGEMTFTCKHEGCGKTYTMPIPKTEHDCATTIVTATCLGYGYTEHTCKDCGYSYISDLIQPRGHSYEAVVTAPTPDEGGYTTHTCTRCGDSYVDELTEALGHKCAAFTDIAGHWAKDFICFATEQGLFQGVTDTTFVPDGAMSRAMAVTVLYRLAGEPEVTGETAFTDVNEEAYYYKALLWASQNEIAKGITETKFAPNGSVTREQAVTFLYRYVVNYLGQEPASGSDLSIFRDAGKISDYARGHGLGRG